MSYEMSLKDSAADFLVFAAKEIVSKETIYAAAGIGIGTVASSIAGYYPMDTAVYLTAGGIAGSAFSRVWRYTGDIDIVAPAKSSADSIVKFFKYAAKETVSLKTLSSIGLATVSVPVSLLALHNPHFTTCFAVGLMVCDVISRAAGTNRVSVSKTPIPA